MAGSIGSVYYDVLPNLDRFASQVAAGIGTQKPVKIRVDADTKGAAAGIKNVTGATTGLDAASRRLASAEGALRVSRARLNETRTKAVAGSARLISAEESHGRALRNLGAAQLAASAAIVPYQSRVSKLLNTVGSPAAQNFGKGMIIGGVGLGVALGGIVGVTADFEQAVSHVAATSDEAKGSIAQLRAEAIKYGASTAFSAKEAANAQEQLIKANVSVTDTINGGLKGALDLAAAGSLGVADAAGIMAVTMSQFKLPGTEASHVADLLAAAAGKAQGEVSDFAGALSYVGPVAQSMGISIEETVGTLALFADQGIKGERAGTSFRSMIVSLTTPIGVGAKEIEKYGINLRDASGEFIGMQAAAGELQDKLGGLGKAERDAALARIFGKNSLTAAIALYEGGAAGVDKWTKAVNDSGFAQKVAGTKMDNLRGDIEKLGGAFQSAFIDTADSSTGGLRGVTQAMTGLVDAYRALPDGTKSTVFLGAGLAAAALIGAGGVIKVVGAVNAANTALNTMAITAPRAAAGLRGLAAFAGPAAIALAAVAVAGEGLSALGTQVKPIDDVSKGLEGLAAGSKDLGALYSGPNWADRLSDNVFMTVGSASDLKTALSTLGAEFDPLGSQVGKAALGFLKFRESITPGEQSMEKMATQVGQVDQALADMVTGGNAAGAAKAYQQLWKESGLPLEVLEPQFAKYRAAVGSIVPPTKDAGTAAQKALGSLDVVGAAVGAIGDKAKTGAAGLEALNAALFASSDAATAAKGSQIAYEAAIDAASAAAKENGETLNVAKDAGRANATALYNQASASRAYLGSLVTQGKSQGDVVRATKSARSAFIENAVAMGKSIPAAERLADTMGLIPKDVRTKFKAEQAAEAARKAKEFEAALKLIPKEQAAKIRALVEKGELKEAKRKLDEFKKPLQALIHPKLDPPALTKALQGLERSVKKETVALISPRIDKGAKAATDRTIANTKGNHVYIAVSPTGIPKTKADIRGIKGIAREAKIEARGVAATQRNFNSLRGIARAAKIEAQGVGSTQRSINGINGVRRDVVVIPQGIGNVQSAINGIHGKTVTITVRKVSVAATGGLFEDTDPIKRSVGGPVWGPGGSTEDKINARLSNGEFVNRTRSVQRYGADLFQAFNDLQIDPDRARALLLTKFNAGGLAQGVHRPVAHVTPGGDTRQAVRVAVMVDLGPELGGIRRIMADAIEDHGEYVASIGRM